MNEEKNTEVVCAADDEVKPDAAPAKPSGMRHTMNRLHSDPETQKNVMLGAAATQLAFSIFLYMLALPPTTMLIFAAVSTAVLLMHYLSVNRGRGWRIAGRICGIAFLSLIIAAFITVMIMLKSFQSGTDTVTDINNEAALLFANFLMPPVLMMQVALAYGASRRLRFDIILMRIASVLAFVCILIFSIAILEITYPATQDQLITCVHSYSWNFFGYPFNLSIAIDNILTRFLFCLSGAITVVVSFLLKKRDAH